nr:MAG TPA: hypothetical protein [Bacteriophage sp.]
MQIPAKIHKIQTDAITGINKPFIKSCKGLQISPKNYFR